MEYNTNREKIMFREYGRTVNKVIENVCSLPDDEKKGGAVRAIVYMMGMISGQSVKDEVSYHKLWDHLMVMSDFKLEKYWPYEAEEIEGLKQRHTMLDVKPEERLPYSERQISSRQYGAHLELMMKKLKEMPDGEEYKYLVRLIAQQAKRSYLAWNGDLSEDKIIVEHLVKMSGDERVREVLGDSAIEVPSGTLPVEEKAHSKKKKKKK